MADTVTLTKELTNCIDCPYHNVVRDPDPTDSFCSDDVAVLCTRTLNTEGKAYWAYRTPFEYAPSTVSCRPYNIIRETTPPPIWCPLRKS